ncbi:MAG: restriction endonuclease subunit S [Thermoproteota archaeon]|jgi:type I restriction enzyme S subunit
MVFAFYKETNFKETPIGEIPKDWGFTRLNNLIDIETGKRAKGGALDKGNVASIGGEHLDNEGNIIWKDMKFIPEDFYESLKQGKVKLGDILLVKDGATTGKVAWIKKFEYEKVAVNEHVFIIRSKADKLINGFLFYFLFSKLGQNQIKTRFHGLIGGIIRDDLETILIPIPSLLEQQKITEILSTVDEAIQKTNEIIAKTERLKKGLMHELLTKGIGHKEFKDTEIGRIPKEWEVAKLSSIAEDIYYGITAKTVKNKQSLRMLRTTDIKNYNVDWNALPFCEVTEKRQDIQRFLLRQGDLIIARAGTTGVSVLVDKDFDDIIFGSYLIKVRLSKKVHPKFMHYFCQSHLYWNHVTSSQAGSTLKNINLPILKSLNVPLPPLLEQQKIAEILSTVDKRLEVERKRKEKLERIKKALMDLLLTGKIRVKVG